MNIFPSETAVNAIHTSFLREPLDTVNRDGLQAQKDLAVFASQRWPLLLTTETRQNFFVVDFARLNKHRKGPLGLTIGREHPPQENLSNRKGGSRLKPLGS
jgi:hypothetical protein